LLIATNQTTNDQFVSVGKCEVRVCGFVLQNAFYPVVVPSKTAACFHSIGIPVLLRRLPGQSDGGMSFILFNIFNFFNKNDTTYDITVDFKDVPKRHQNNQFRRAAARWSSVIGGDVDDVDGDTLSQYPGTVCGPYPKKIDDLYVCASYEQIDGLGGVLGSTMPLIYRENFLAISGSLEFDEDDISLMIQWGALDGVIVRELLSR
jgi:hypothetical protein